jgi:hypothetical protein
MMYDRILIRSVTLPPLLVPTIDPVVKPPLLEFVSVRLRRWVVVRSRWIRIIVFRRWTILVEGLVTRRVNVVGVVVPFVVVAPGRRSKLAGFFPLSSRGSRCTRNGRRWFWVLVVSFSSKDAYGQC